MITSFEKYFDHFDDYDYLNHDGVHYCETPPVQGPPTPPIQGPQEETIEIPF